MREFMKHPTVAIGPRDIYWKSMEFLLRFNFLMSGFQNKAFLSACFLVDVTGKTGHLPINAYQKTESVLNASRAAAPAPRDR